MVIILGSPEFGKNLDDFSMSVMVCVMERRSACAVLCVCVCSGFGDEQFDHVHVACPGSLVERGLQKVVSGVRVCAELDKFVCRLDMPIQGGFVQRRAAILVFDMEINLVFNDEQL